MPLRLCVLLWENDGRAADLHRYEDAVLALLPDHGAGLVSRDVVTDRGPEDPLEVQMIVLPGPAALDAYMSDPRRTTLEPDRDRAIARTQVLTLT